MSDQETKVLSDKPHADQNKCSDCGNDIPDYPECVQGTGFVSPESKVDAVQENGTTAVVARQKQVCKECYHAAFKRVYPDAELPHAA